RERKQAIEARSTLQDEPDAVQELSPVGHYGLHLFLAACNQLRKKEPCSTIVANRGERGHIQDRSQARVSEFADPRRLLDTASRLILTRIESGMSDDLLDRHRRIE